MTEQFAVFQQEPAFQALVSQFALAGSLSRIPELDDMPESRRAAIAADTASGEGQEVMHAALQELQSNLSDSMTFSGDVDVANFGTEINTDKNFAEAEAERKARGHNKPRGVE